MSLVIQDLHEPTPHHDDGPWPHILLTSTQAFYADDAGDLVRQYIPEYQSTAEDADAELAEGAIDVATRLQRSLFDAAVRNNAVDLADEDLLTLLMESKEFPIPAREDGQVLTYVDTDMPLVIANSAYLQADGSMLEMPQGPGVIIIDGSGEKEFLASLDDVGIHKHVMADHAAV